MSIFADSLRPFWLEGLNDISGHFKKDIGGWICDEEFQVYSEVRAAEFTLNMSEPEELLEAYAAEVNRIAIASFETMNTLQRSVRIKKINCVACDTDLLFCILRSPYFDANDWH
jgi:hypothetical protein